jgi:hypothetical protein
MPVEIVKPGTRAAARDFNRASGFQFGDDGQAAGKARIGGLIFLDAEKLGQPFAASRLFSAWSAFRERHVFLPSMSGTARRRKRVKRG